MDPRELEELDERWSMHNYRRFGVEFVEGSGTRLIDSEGREYLDFLTGIAVCSLGHCHPDVVAAIEDQAGRLMHTSNLFLSGPAVELARRLAESSLGGATFLCNSGAEANEAAIKIARKAAHTRGVSNPRVVVLEGGFHGRTMGAVSASPKMSQDPSFAPYLEGFDVVPRDDVDSLDHAVGEQTAGILIEPVQGEGGIHPIADSVLSAARSAADRTGAALIFDEVQCGMGRTGSLWGYQLSGIEPDLLTTAKALGGGFPVGSCIASRSWSSVFEPGDHGSTFAGGPMASRAALAALEATSDPGLMDSVSARGERLRAGLAGIPAFSEVRGRGLMVGADLASGGGAPDLVTDLLGKGLITNATGPATLRLLPPLIVTDQEVDRALELISDSVS